MKTNKPASGSGKTMFNRGKPHGKSWNDLREEAKAKGWKPAKTFKTKEEREMEK